MIQAFQKTYLDRFQQKHFQNVNCRGYYYDKWLILQEEMRQVLDLVWFRALTQYRKPLHKCQT